MLLKDLVMIKPPVLFTIIFFSQSSAFAQSAPQNEVQGSKQAAQNPNGKIIQIFRDTKRVVAQYDIEPTDISIGTKLNVTTADGESCTGTALNRSTDKVSIDFLGCSAFSGFKVGILVERDISNESRSIQPTAPKEQVLPNEEGWKKTDRHSRGLRLALGLFYSSANEITFDSLTGSAGTTAFTGKAKYITNASPGFLIEGFSSNVDAWGFNFGLSIDGKRKLTSYETTINSGGTSVLTSGATSGDPALTISTLYFNAIYRWTMFYIPFGLNFSGVAVDNPPPALLGLKGNVGAQLGIGFLIDDRFALEIISRALTVTAQSYTSGTTTLNLGNGFLTGGQFTGKYLF